MRLKVGQTLRSVTDATSVIVVKAPDADLSVTCGGLEVVDAADAVAGSAPAPIVAGADAGTKVGKRYTDEAASIELLCIKAGQGTLAVDGTPLTIKSAQALPASD